MTCVYMYENLPSLVREDCTPQAWHGFLIARPNHQELLTSRQFLEIKGKKLEVQNRKAIGGCGNGADSWNTIKYHLEYILARDQEARFFVSFV